MAALEVREGARPLRERFRDLHDRIRAEAVYVHWVRFVWFNGQRNQGGEDALTADVAHRPCRRKPHGLAFYRPPALAASIHAPCTAGRLQSGYPCGFSGRHFADLCDGGSTPDRAGGGARCSDAAGPGWQAGVASAGRLRRPFRARAPAAVRPRATVRPPAAVRRRAMATARCAVAPGCRAWRCSRPCRQRGSALRRRPARWR